MKCLMESVSNPADYKFLIETLANMVEAKRVITMTYVIGYFMKDDTTSKK